MILSRPPARTGALCVLLALAPPAAAAAGEPTAPRVVVPAPAVRDGVIDPARLAIAAPAKSARPHVVPNQFPPPAEIPGAGRADNGMPPSRGPVTFVLDTSPPAASRTPSALPPIDTRFDGAFDGGWTPPDPTFAVGRGHVVSIVNLQVAFYTKAGALASGPFSLPSFFGVPGGFSTFDPLSLYDPFTDRFILMVAADNGPAKDSRFYIAFSQTGDPTLAWNKYFIRNDAGQDGTPGALPDNWADYPSAGLDRLALYMTANMFARTGGFSNVTLFTVDKEAGYAGAPLRTAHLIDVRTAGNGAPFRLRPAFVPQVTPNDEYYLMHADQTFGSALNLFRLTGDRFRSPALAASTIALGGTYFPPGRAHQPGATQHAVDVLGANLWNVYYRAGTLWTAQSVSGTQADAAWVHRVNVLANPATREQTWQLEATGLDTFFPYVLPAPLTNDFAMLAAASGTTQYPTGRYWNVSAAGTVRAAELTATSTNRNDSDRYGDYFAIASDPLDRNRMWMGTEYMKNGNTFTGYHGIASVRFEDLPAPVAPPPVPDGRAVPGNEVRLARAAGGQVTVTWDAARCTPAPAGHHLVWFDLAALSGYRIAGETCGAGSSGTWTGAPPAGNVAVLVVSDDNARTEGAHGADSAGRERPSTSGACGFAQKIAWGTCGP